MWQCIVTPSGKTYMQRFSQQEFTVYAEADSVIYIITKSMHAP